MKQSPQPQLQSYQHSLQPSQFHPQENQFSPYIHHQQLLQPPTHCIHAQSQYNIQHRKQIHVTQPLSQQQISSQPFHLHKCQSNTNLHQTSKPSLNFNHAQKLSNTYSNMTMAPMFTSNPYISDCNKKSNVAQEVQNFIQFEDTGSSNVSSTLIDSNSELNSLHTHRVDYLRTLHGSDSVFNSTFDTNRGSISHAIIDDTSLRTNSAHYPLLQNQNRSGIIKGSVVPSLRGTMFFT